MGSHLLRLFAAFHIFLAFTSTFGNAVILAALNKASSLHPPSKILLRSLAFTDLCVGILLEPPFAVYLITIDYKSFDLCVRLFNLGVATAQVFCFASLFTLTAISVDRLLAMLLGMRYRQVVTVKRVIVVLICLWSFSIGFPAAMVWNKVFNFYYFVLSDSFCLITSSCCYIKIYLKLSHHQAQIQGHVHQGQPNWHEPLNIARYRKTVSSALWIQFSVLACYLPMGIVMVLITVRGVEPSLIVAWIPVATILFFNSTLNPILYCWKIREVRQAVREIIRQISCCLSS